MKQIWLSKYDLKLRFSIRVDNRSIGIKSQSFPKSGFDS